ncbi:hypothetical protein [Vulcanisaeta souniana]|uniref:Flagellin n=2 Tax=Vulcanisaeta souniana JCM 11219 TaxID=1293586 RepID=A0ABN6SW80_9CREN|nr:hypothetical protein [Vulcanisaeta souniana]BDR93301.1 hypothetical protein Vsou_23940 [Vulcanisaeta souniana JCM 11219]
MDMSRGLSETISMVIMMGVVIALGLIFYIIVGINFGKASASVSVSQVETLFDNIATDLDSALSSPMPSNVLSYPVFMTNYGTYNVAPSFCNLTINGITVYSSGGVVFGVSPGYGSMPSGYINVLLGNRSLIVANESSNLFNVVFYGASTVSGVTYGEFIALYPRVVVFTMSNGQYELLVPVLIGRFNPSLSNLLVFNVTYPISVNYNYDRPGTYVINYTCGARNELLSSDVVLNGKIEILPMYIYVYYG